MDLRDAGRPLGAQVAAGLADGLCRHDVVLRSQDCVGDDDGRCDVELVVGGHARVAAFVDAEAVDVRDALDPGRVLSEQLEDGLPERGGDADLRRHAALAMLDRPAYAGPSSAMWMRLRVASSRSLPGRHVWSPPGT